jgi:hypothetical protein
MRSGAGNVVGTVPKNGNKRFNIEEDGGGGVATEAPPKKGRGRKPATTGPIEIPAPRFNVIEIPIEGTSVLVVNKMSHKAQQEMLDKHMKKPKQAKEAKVPFDDFKGSLHVIPGCESKVARLPKLTSGRSWPYKPFFCFPASAFKKAALSSTKLLDGISRSLVSISVRVLGEWVPIKYKRLEMRQDVVRIGPYGNRVPDIRFRGGFEEWSCVLQVRYNANIFSDKQVVALFEHAGMVGIGEHRPEKEGEWGTFSVKRAH